MHRDSRAAWLLLSAGSLLLSGCQKTAETTAAAKTTPAPAPGSAQRKRITFMSGTSLRIVSVSPDTVNIYKGYALPQRFLVTYEIDVAEKEKDMKAAISVRSEGVGTLQRFDVAVEPHAQVDFLLNASSFDLGPTVRFQVRCPAGDSDWYTMGSSGTPYSPQVSTPQIGNVVPTHIPTPGSRSGYGVPVTIAGMNFTQGCTPEAKVDEIPVELQHVFVFNSEIRSVFPYTYLQGRPVSERRLSLILDLLSTTKGIGGYGDTFQLNFKE